MIETLKFPYQIGYTGNLQLLGLSPREAIRNNRYGQTEQLKDMQDISSAN